MSERLKINEYYENPEQFVEEINSIKVVNFDSNLGVQMNDKELIKKLKRWYKTYGIDMNLYESQYARLQMILKDRID